MKLDKQFYWKLSLGGILGTIGALVSPLFGSGLTSTYYPSIHCILPSLKGPCQEYVWFFFAGGFLILTCFSLLQFMRLTTKEKGGQQWKALVLVAILLAAFIYIGVFIADVFVLDLTNSCRGECAETCLRPGGRLCSTPCPPNYLIKGAADVPEGYYCCSLIYAGEC